MIVPVPDDGVKAILTEVELITVAAPIVSALETVVIDVDGVDGIDVPVEFVAVIVNV